jgi:alpha-glucosidase
VAAWWERAVIYQVYPRSFMDASGDGVGDLKGITGRLEYLSWLGVDAVWISPFYPSPMADFGYDVTDYVGVDPLFGTLSDFDGLVEEAHSLSLRVILDYVPNHTSDEHPWFVASRSSKEDPKREWYIWADPKPDGSPPNNWLSVFGGPAWTFDEGTGQYYYHAYLREQPDLNWRNPEVREAMYDVLRFWLERGVDGFRVDALRQLVKDERFRDNLPNPEWRPGQSPYDALLPVHSADRPEVHEATREMRAVLAEYGDDRLLIGELYLPIERLVRYYGEGGSGVHLPFNFHLISAPWQAGAIAGLIETYEAALPPGGWPTWVLGNHDRSRVASRVGRAQARVAAMLLLTLRGTPTLYYGDEIGMTDVPIPPEKVQDPWEKNVPGIGVGRDPARTPMQWDATPNAGFTTGTPWLPVSGDHASTNVEAQRDDPRSILSLVRRLLQLRREHPALALGSYGQLDTRDAPVVAYLREHETQRILVVLNLGEREERLELPADAAGAELLCSTDPERPALDESKVLKLGPHEGVVLALQSTSLND